jgi:uncharacterized protein (DUF302 family)
MFIFCLIATVKAQDQRKMATRKVEVDRISLTSSRPFSDVVAKIEAAVGHPDMRLFQQKITAAKDRREVEKVVNESVGQSGFMEFARYDLGSYLRKSDPHAPQVLRLVIGNPMIMRQMVSVTPDAGSYAPVTILIDERPDGVHLSYDKMASLLAPYGNAQALKVAQDLDAKVEGLLNATAF